MSAVFTQAKFVGFWAKFWPWLRRWWYTLVVPVALVLVASQWFTIAVNASDSLPHSFYLVQKWKKDIYKHQYVAFTYPGEHAYSKRLPWIKRIAGVPGDVVSVSGRVVFVGGLEVGKAKPHGKSGILQGRPLALGPTGVIPPGHFYAQGDHVDSLDSRYALMGWVPQEQIVGRAIPLF